MITDKINENCVDILLDKAKEELRDVVAYGELYDKLAAKGMHGEARVIEEIAKDEHEHAEVLCELLEEHGHMKRDDAELKDLWHKANEAFDMY